MVYREKKAPAAGPNAAIKLMGRAIPKLEKSISMIPNLINSAIGIKIIHDHKNVTIKKRIGILLSIKISQIYIIIFLHIM